MPSTTAQKFLLSQKSQSTNLMRRPNRKSSMTLRKKSRRSKRPDKKKRKLSRS